MLIQRAFQLFLFKNGNLCLAEQWWQGEVQADIPESQLHYMTITQVAILGCLKIVRLGLDLTLMPYSVTKFYQTEETEIFFPFAFLETVSSF